MELFVFDIDGTLVANFGEMTDEVVSSLNKLLERGDMVVLQVVDVKVESNDIWIV